MKRAPGLKRLPMPSAWSCVTWALYLLNRAYAHWSFLVNYTLYAFLWIAGHGLPPSTDTRPAPARRGVLVTACDTPVGHQTALLLARSGYTVFAAATEPSAGVPLVNKFTAHPSLRTTPGGAVHTLVCAPNDKVSVEAAAAAVSRLLNNNPRIKLVSVVCIAQDDQLAPLESMSDASISQTITHNLLPHITLTRAFLPLLRHPSTQSRILFLTSAIGYTPLPGRTLSSATSAAIDSLARALTVELTASGSNVRATVIRHGSIITGPTADARFMQLHQHEKHVSYSRMMRIWSYLRMYQRRLGSPPIHIAKQVRDALMDLWLQPCYTVGWDALLAQALRDFVPEPVYEWLLLKLFT